MTARVTIVAGPARSGKTERLLGLYRAALATGGGLEAAESCLWLAPSRRAVEQIRERLADATLPGCFSPGITTFANFADRVLDYADDDIRPIDDRMQRLLVERIVATMHEGGKLKHFGSISHTSGMIDLVVEFIRELKRDEIWPEQFEQACRERAVRRTPKDMELAAVYRRYQELLLEHRLYDDEGRFWAARDRLQHGQLRPFERLRFVVVDGFSDLTRTQHEIVDLLAGRVEQLYVGLAYDAAGGREDLFLKPSRTLDNLRQSHPTLHVEQLPPSPTAPTRALRHVERELFKNPRRVKQVADAAGIEVLAAAGRVGEIEEIARRIKRLLLEGDGGRPVRPDDVAVVFRSLGEIAPLVREIFTRYGLPFALEAGRTLDQSPSLTALAALLELDRDDWTFRRLLCVTGSNFFRPEGTHAGWPELQTAIETTVRAFQVPDGRTALLECIGACATSAPREIVPGSPSAERDAQHETRRRAAVRAFPILQELAAALDALPQRASASAWSEALKQLANRTGLVAQMNQAHRLAPTVTTPIDAEADFKAWSRFHKLLKSADALTEFLDEDAAEFDRDELLDVVKHLLTTEQLPGDHDETGRVRVLSVVSARSLTFPIVFLAGLNEKAFPASIREDRLYGDVDYQQLIQTGLRLNSAAERFADEMLFFYEAVTRADRRLVLSYAALNDKAEPLLPSPYLVELNGLFAAGAIARTELHDLTSIPAADAIVTTNDRRVRAVAAAVKGNPQELGDVLRIVDAPTVNLAAGLRAVHERGRGQGFGPYEGMLADPRALALAARRFDLDFPWSAGQLEEYGRCPFQFFLHRVLKLRVPEEVVLAVDHGRRGNRMHDLLAELHGRMNVVHGGAALPREIEAAKLARWIDELIDKQIDDDGGPLAAALGEIDRRLMRSWLGEYTAQHERYERTYEGPNEPVRPAHFEASFGSPPRDDDSISTADALVLGEGREQIRITGRIDRIDLGSAAGKPIFSIIDYKTGSGRTYTAAHVRSGRALQLTLYAVAVERLLLADRDAVPWQFGYWFVADGGFKKTLALQEITPTGLRPVAEWSQLRDRVIDQVLSLVRGVRRGEFPMHNDDEHCGSYCDFRTVCRVAQVRALEKSWQPPTPEAS
jgi:ATP-dependent helicase/nuclease subunit B